MELIRLENITKTYHLGEVDVPVLKGITLSIQRGEMVALMGASGSGKTTLMNILGCLDRPTSGQYWLDGQEMSHLSPNQRALVRTAKLGFVFQSFNLLPRTTALANVIMPLDYAPQRPHGREARRLADGLLARVGLADRLDHEPSQMSGGQQQRVAIARSLVNRPALLLADEPTGNLDSHTSVEILEMFRQLNAEGISVILVTHDPKVASYATRVIRISDGLIEGDESRVASTGDDRLDGKSRSGWSPVPSPHIADGDGADDNGIAAVAASQTTAALVLASGGRATVQPAPQAVHAGHLPAPHLPAFEPASKPSGAAQASSYGDPAAAREWTATSLFPPTFRTAMGALKRNKMRSVLTALGVIIGVGAVIAMTEIGEGSKAANQKIIASMGANNILVFPGAAASGGVSFGGGSVQTLTPDDMKEIVRQCPAVADAAPVVRVGKAQIVYGNRNWNTSVTGTTPSYLAVRDWEGTEEGDVLSDRDVLNRSKVCLIGTTLKRELFQDESPVGQEIRIMNVSFRVIGVLSRKGANMMGQDQDDIVVAPWTTIKYHISGVSSNAVQNAASKDTSNQVNSLNNLYPGGSALYISPSAMQAADTPQPIRSGTVDQILVKAASAEQIPLAMDQITELLHERHHIRPGRDDDFNLRDATEMSRAMSSQTENMGALLLVVAAISLVVGGVGIMNIMLVSVTERTREIGLRMAVGARSYHILRQFLVEAVVLCLVGGAIGILLGRIASILVRAIKNWHTQPSLMIIAGAVAVSATVGIIFGFYPAWKASRLDPIEALRYE
jgi:macrolide transport system ATP-binding/permease protein